LALGRPATPRAVSGSERVIDGGTVHTV